MDNQKPSVGRIVHYTQEDGTHIAGIITHVYEGKLAESSCVDLTCFVLHQLKFRNKVKLDPSAKYKDTWHWAERV